MKYIDEFLNNITMYRLLLYYLIALVGVGVILSFFGILAFSPLALIFSSLFLVTVGYVANKIFAYLFKAPTNIESIYISALILSLIISPARNFHDIIFLFAAAVLAAASKFIFAIGRKHIFNPAALAVTITSLTSIGFASWWVGTLWMAPFVLLGILIVRKIRRFDLVFYFFIAALLTIVGLGFLRGADPMLVLKATFFESPILFFAFIMLTEPLTTPPTKTLQSIYGALVGILFSPQFAIMGFYTTPEIALLIGNIFSYIVSPKYKLLLKLKSKFQETDDICNFMFARPKNFSFIPGQYMEWTLSHKGTDSRGNRRYLTIASSPTEDNIMLGIRFTNNGSSYKKALDNLDDKTQICATSLAGDFSLPRDSSKKLVFIAGGIGVTPFRSIIKYLIDKGEKREIVLFYANKTLAEAVYKDVFAEAQKKLGIKTIYLTEHLTPELIKQEVSDYTFRTFYISGPEAMVNAYKLLLKQLKIPDKQIITDYFPGY